MTLKDEGFTGAKEGESVFLVQKRRAKTWGCESVQYTCPMTGGAGSQWEGSKWMVIRLERCKADCKKPG